MSYELRAILEYDAARLEIIRLGDEISKSTWVSGEKYFGRRKCTSDTEKQCFELLWDWNTKHLEYDRWNNSCYPYEECGDEPELPEGDEPPVLCECCKVTQQLVDDRKAAKKRFGIAKVRLSRIARDHRNSTVLQVPEL
jgi:hypothetical protein